MSECRLADLCRLGRSEKAALELIEAKQEDRLRNIRRGIRAKTEAKLAKTGASGQFLNEATSLSRFAYQSVRTGEVVLGRRARAIVMDKDSVATNKVRPELAYN